MEATIAGFTPAGMQPQQTNMPLGGGPVSMGIASTPTAEQQGRMPIETPRGMIYATQEQASNMYTPRTIDQQSSRTPEQQQALLARARESGLQIRANLAEQQKQRDQEGIQRGYAFRQNIAEREAQKALDPSRSFGTVGRNARMRGAQAMVEAERWKQAQAGRDPMSREPLSAIGMQFQRGPMGQYSPIRNIRSQTFSPFSKTPSMGAPAPFSSPTGMGDIFSSFRAFDDEYQSPFYSFGNRI
jgi:hypothetical protein